MDYTFWHSKAPVFILFSSIEVFTELSKIIYLNSIVIAIIMIIVVMIILQSGDFLIMNVIIMVAGMIMQSGWCMKVVGCISSSYSGKS